MAVRLKYSGPDGLSPEVVRPPEEALYTALSAAAPGTTLYVLATYTAMLELWEVLRKTKAGDQRVRDERAPGS
jgi:hypothetical protein